MNSENVASTNEQVNYYESLSPEEKQKFDADTKHYWDVEAPETLRQNKAAAEREWSERRLTFAWMNSPDNGMADFGGYQWVCLEDPQTPCRRIIRFSLPGGGQLRAIETFVAHRHSKLCNDSKYRCDSVDQVWEPINLPGFGHVEAHLQVTAETDGHLHRYHGSAQTTYPNEMSAAAVVFDHGTPQIVANRAARILELSTTPENFYALLDGIDRCAFCRHPLRDEVSKLVAVGPDCAKLYNLPHTLEAASKRLALRKKLLAEMAGAL